MLKLWWYPITFNLLNDNNKELLHIKPFYCVIENEHNLCYWILRWLIWWIRDDTLISCKYWTQLNYNKYIVIEQKISFCIH